MFTLETFYKTKEWENLLKVLKLERVNEDGVIICEHCHKPIVNAYDCIGHHSIFLTPQNINDINISLNPDLIQFVHHRCHNRIHNKLGRTRREVFVVYPPKRPLSLPSYGLTNLPRQAEQSTTAPFARTPRKTAYPPARLTPRPYT